MTRWYMGAIVALIGLVLVSAWWIQVADRETREAFTAEDTALLHHLDAATEPRPWPAPTARQSAGTLPAAAQRSAPRKPILAEIASSALLLNSPERSASDDLEVVHGLIEYFQRANAGVIPAGGLNEEIVDRLRGKNDIGLAVLPEKVPALDTEGRLLDRWNTPYFFHPVSAHELEIRSAGPDRKFGTKDDLF